MANRSGNGANLRMGWDRGGIGDRTISVCDNAIVSAANGTRFAYSVDFAADIICCDAQGPGWQPP